MMADKPIRILKPAILPDDAWLFYAVWAVEGAALLWGLIEHSPIAIALAIIIACVFPGMAIFFHGIFHFTARFEIFDDGFAFISRNPFERFLKVPKRQEMAYTEVAYAYYLEKEIALLKKHSRHTSKRNELDDESDADLSKIFLETRVDLLKYIRTERSAGGLIGTARARAYLVLSNRDGTHKVYIANFYDLSGQDSRYFLQTLKRHNENVRFLMNPNKIRRLIGPDAG